MLKTTSILFVTTLALSVPAAAQDWDGPDEGQGMHGGMHRGMYLKMMDKNEDRAISREEFESHQSDRFASADADGDGEVTMDEFTAFVEEEKSRRRAMRQQHMFNRLDSNGDGVISQEETTAHTANVFDRMDRNDDGKLDVSDRPEGGKGKGWRQ